MTGDYRVNPCEWLAVLAARPTTEVVSAEPASAVGRFTIKRTRQIDSTAPRRKNARELRPPSQRPNGKSRVNDDAQLDDAQLIEATRAGDNSAYGRLVERYQDRLVGAVTRFLGCREDAHDVAQDAFVQAYLKLDTFRGASAFYTWLYRIAFNLAMSHARRRRTMLSLDGAKDGFGSEPMDTAEGPDAGLQRDERAALVHDALQQLDDEFRLVVVLRELEGSSYDQIAEILEIPIGTVRSRLFRARMQLRDRLAPLLHERAKETT